MKVLVFGKTGQVARELLRQAPEGTTVEALGRDDADLADAEACAALIAATDADAVVNAAAYTAVDRAEEEEALATRINGTAPAAMARAAATRGLPFLHLSTDYVFDGSGTRPWQPQDATAPLNAYGRSKRQGEIGVLTAGGSGIVLRVSSVFSAHGRNFLRTMLDLGHSRDRLRIVADQISGPTPAADIARAIHVIIRDPRRAGELPAIFHFAGQPDVSWAGFAREIFRQAGLDVAVEEIPTIAWPAPAERPHNSRLDCCGLVMAYGIARPDWRQGVTEVLLELGHSVQTAEA